MIKIHDSMTNFNESEMIKEWLEIKIYYYAKRRKTAAVIRLQFKQNKLQLLSFIIKNNRKTRDV